MAMVRRPKWHPQQPPTPRILHLPRRTFRRKPTTKTTAIKPRINNYNNDKGKLEKLFDQERAFSYTIPPIVLLNSEERGKNENTHAPAENEQQQQEDDDKWRFQAEMLRAECNFLRIEREIANKKLERERVFLEKSLKSAVHTLLSGKKKLHEGESANLVLEEEIEDLAKKLIELQKSSKVKSPEMHNCSNFDKQASLLKKQLEKYNEMQGENRVKEVPEVSAISLPVNSTRNRKMIKGHGSCRRSTRFTDVELLRRKVEGLSKGKLLKRMEEEYGYMLSATTANYSAHSAASTSKRYDLMDSSSILYQQSLQDAKSGEHNMCSGRCKAVVKRIMEQVKAETEQWSQMQEMLGQVKEEMEELQASRDFWEEQALESEKRIQTLHSDAEDWKQKAVSLEVKENQLQKQVEDLQQELKKLEAEKSSEHHVKVCKDSTPISLGAQLAREKRILMCRVKGSNLRSEKNNKNNKNNNNNNNNNDQSSENNKINQRSENSNKIDVESNDGTKTAQESRSKLASLNRHPLKEISNASPLVRQNSRRYVYPLHNPKDF